MSSYVTSNEESAMFGGPGRWVIRQSIFFTFYIAFVSMMGFPVRISATSASSLYGQDRPGVNNAILGAAALRLTYMFETRALEDELVGMYSVIGTMDQSEGTPQQIHPQSCELDVLVYVPRPWVALIILEDAYLSRCTEIQLARKVSDLGASAVIFDMKNKRDAALQLSNSSIPMNIPVILLDGQDAHKIRSIIKNAVLSSSILYISPNVNEQNPDDRRIWIIIICIVVFCVFCGIIGIIVKWKCHQGRAPASMADVAKDLLSKMQTRKCTVLDINMDSCSICLEDYKEGQELRILPCNHVFHKKCVDPWLIKNRPLCPLCLYNIVVGHNDYEHSLCSTSDTHESPPGLRNMTSDPNIVHHSPQQSHYYPAPQHMGYHGYHYNHPLARNHPYHELQFPTIDMTQLHSPGTNLFVPQYSQNYMPDLNYHLLRYSVLPLNSGIHANLLTGMHEPNIEPLSPNFVYSDQRVTNTRNSGNHLASRRRPQGRHKSTLPRTRSQNNSRLQECDDYSSSSDSDCSKKCMHVRTDLFETQYASSHCDADVSETSTGGGADSDGQSGQSTGSQVNLSIKSVFGSSEVPSDISSCDVNIYGAEGDQIEEKHHSEVNISNPESGSSGILLQPACMNAKRIMSSKRKHRLYDEWGTEVLVPRGTPEDEDSDQTVSSVDTQEMSPRVSGWSSNSGSDGNNATSSQFTNMPFMHRLPVCPLCHSSEPHSLAPNVNRSALTRFRNEQFIGGPLSLMHRHPPDIKSPFTYRFQPFNAQVNAIKPHRNVQNYTEWEAGFPLSPHAEQLRQGSFSKAGSTCSFYCYPSNSSPSNPHSSASSSPRHTHHPVDGATNYNNHKSLIVHSNQRGHVMTNTLNPSAFPFHNII